MKRGDEPVNPRAPIFTAGWDLSVWLLNHARGTPDDLLARTLAQEALLLLDQITLALKNIDRDAALDEADRALIRLRLRLRLAMEIGLLNERQGQYGLELADSVGRQLGGWQKALDAAQ